MQKTTKTSKAATHRVIIILERKTALALDNAGDNEFEGTEAERLTEQARVEVLGAIRADWIDGKLVGVMLQPDASTATEPATLPLLSAGAL